VQETFTVMNPAASHAPSQFPIRWLQAKAGRMLRLREMRQEMKRLGEGV
jgi:hypothetical protein